LGPLFRKKGDGGLETFEFEIRSGSYLKAVGGPVVHKQIQPMVAHVKSDLLLKKSRGDFSPRLTLG